MEYDGNFHYLAFFPYAAFTYVDMWCLANPIRVESADHIKWGEPDIVANPVNGIVCHVTTLEPRFFVSF